jgi:hypothetical protein
MESHKLGLGIFIIVGAIALASFAMVYHSTQGNMVIQTYEQPSNHKPLFLQTNNFLPNYDLCQQYLCTASADVYGAGEYPHAEQIGVEKYTGNLRCGCPDGKEFQARPDRIEVNNY